jgi:G3E family GTPase
MGVILNDMTLAEDERLSYAQEHPDIPQPTVWFDIKLGCICCGDARGRFVERVDSLVQDFNFDYILVEADGVAQPVNVAEAFESQLEGEEITLQGEAHLDTCVTVLDATAMMGNM